MELPPSQMTVLGWTDVAAIGLFDVRVFNPYAPSNRQPLIAKARPTMLCISTSYNIHSTSNNIHTDSREEEDTQWRQIITLYTRILLIQHISSVYYMTDNRMT